MSVNKSSSPAQNIIQYKHIIPSHPAGSIFV